MPALLKPMSQTRTMQVQALKPKPQPTSAPKIIEHRAFAEGLKKTWATREAMRLAGLRRLAQERQVKLGSDGYVEDGEQEHDDSSREAHCRERRNNLAVWAANEAVGIT